MRFASALCVVVYVLFAAACFRLVWLDKGWGLALGEGLFTLLGASGLAWATFAHRYRSVVAIAATTPLVGWFLATPRNSGPPYLVASLLAPTGAAVAWLLTRRT